MKMPIFNQVKARFRKPTVSPAFDAIQVVVARPCIAPRNIVFHDVVGMESASKSDVLLSRKGISNEMNACVSVTIQKGLIIDLVFKTDLFGSCRYASFTLMKTTIFWPLERAWKISVISCTHCISLKKCWQISDWNCGLFGNVDWIESGTCLRKILSWSISGMHRVVSASEIENVTANRKCVEFLFSGLRVLCDSFRKAISSESWLWSWS